MRLSVAAVNATLIIIADTGSPHRPPRQTAAGVLADAGVRVSCVTLFSPRAAWPRNGKPLHFLKARCHLMITRGSGRSMRVLPPFMQGATMRGQWLMNDMLWSFSLAVAGGRSKPQVLGASFCRASAMKGRGICACTGLKSRASKVSRSLRCPSPSTEACLNPACWMDGWMAAKAVVLVAIYRKRQGKLAVDHLAHLALLFDAQRGGCVSASIRSRAHSQYG